MKKLITHIRPHIDDVCALWLLKRWFPDAKDAALDFIPTDEKGGKTVDDPEIVYIGIGRGKFDEHKGDIGQCATTLVFAYLKEQVSLGTIDRRALEKIVQWVLMEDTGRLSAAPYREFGVTAALQGQYDVADKDSSSVADLGFRILDALFATQKNMVVLDDNWQKRREFSSRFGKAVALESAAREVDSYAYARGFDIVAYMNPDGSYHTIRAKADSPINLQPVHEELKKRDPGATWYLHHSNKMLICGGEITSGATPSKLSLDDLIALLR